MGIGEFLLWLERAKVDERCEAARSVARTLMSGALDPEERCAVDAALMILLDDQSGKVRRALSEILSLSAHAPAAALHALALDQPDVAAPVLARCPLSDGTLVQVLEKGDADTAALIADRAKVSEGLALSIARLGDLRACLALVTNPGARCTEAVFAEIISRLSAESAELRGVLAMDERLSLALRQKLTEAAAAALRSSRFVNALLGAKRARAVCDEATDETPLLLTETAPLNQIPHYVQSLNGTGRLTAGLLMRALVHGRIDFAAGIIAHLSGQPDSRVRAVLVRGGTPAVTALLKESGMKGAMASLGARALELWRSVATGRASLGRQDIAWQLAVAASNIEGRGGNDDVAAFMRRIHIDVARAVAQENARGLVEVARQEEQAALAAEAAFEESFLAEFSDIRFSLQSVDAADDEAGLEEIIIDGLHLLVPQYESVETDHLEPKMKAPLSEADFIFELNGIFAGTAPATDRVAA